MELRVLRYFLAVAEERNISRAARLLHVTQPTLSRQLMDLERELGCALFTRGSHSVSLTPKGRLLRRRAEDIVGLVEHTKREFHPEHQNLSGEIFIGAGEGYAFQQLARCACELRRRHPNIVFRLYSGNKDDVAERLDKGLLDFGLIIQPANLSRYHSFPMMRKEVWGLVMRKDCPLAKKREIAREDLNDIPLLVSRQVPQGRERGDALLAWLGAEQHYLHLAATYNLIFNAALMVREGLGCAIALEHLIDDGENSPLCFRPFTPRIESAVDLVWSRGRPLSAAATAFLEILKGEAPVT